MNSDLILDLIKDYNDAYRSAVKEGIKQGLELACKAIDEYQCTIASKCDGDGENCFEALKEEIRKMVNR